MTVDNIIRDLAQAIDCADTAMLCDGVAVWLKDLAPTAAERSALCATLRRSGCGVYPSRCDMVQTHDDAVVAASETTDGPAVQHWVIVTPALVEAARKAAMAAGNAPLLAALDNLDDELSYAH